MAKLNGRTQIGGHGNKCDVGVGYAMGGGRARKLRSKWSPYEPDRGFFNTPPLEPPTPLPHALQNLRPICHLDD
jgi:hypothetical protein